MENKALERIVEVNKGIEFNLSNSKSYRGLYAQNILDKLRNLLEYLALFIYNDKNKTNLDWDYENLQKSIKYIGDKPQYKEIYFFHKRLQISVSHYTNDEETSERLMLNYLLHLNKIKKFFAQNYNIELLTNINDFPMNLDTLSLEYCEKIAERIKRTFSTEQRQERFYIYSIKPFMVDKTIYYELTLTIASDHRSKFNKIIAFTHLDILKNYAVRLYLYNTHININNIKMPITIITEWSVDIRPCEIQNFCAIFNNNRINFTRTKEYEKFMRFLTQKEINLLELIYFQKEYEQIKSSFNKNYNFKSLFSYLDKAREIILNNKRGANILRYILYTMNNKIIKKQIAGKKNKELSNLLLDFGCIPFETMPFCSSLKNHNPTLTDLLDCISVEDRKDELLARKIKNNSEINGYLYTDTRDLTQFLGNDDIGELIDSYNQKLYYKHRDNRKMEKYQNFLYLLEYEESIKNIKQFLEQFSQNGIENYEIQMQQWLQNNNLDSEEKIDSLKNLFTQSRLALIYGSAGTGKTTMIRHISDFFHHKSKLYLANTYAAINNLRQRIKGIENSDFETIAAAKHKKDLEYEIVIIDECSTISNADMAKILAKIQPQVLICVGDIYQIESIRFGNWFLFAKKFFSNIAIELKKTHRTQDEKLKKLWGKVRMLERDMLEVMVKEKYSQRLESFNFKTTCENEIILCLNYGGIYGINNVNRILQENNKNPSHYFKGLNYKVGDPILFNEVKRFDESLYNNLKGVITSIQYTRDAISFNIKVDKEITSSNEHFKIMKNGKGWTEIQLFVFEHNGDEDDKSFNVVPFQVAYAISIHKAQGLEYDNVVIIIPDEIEEQITHNIFYTAITRAKKHLAIYWSPETEKKVLEHLKAKDINRDYQLLKSKLKNIDNQYK